MNFLHSIVWSDRARLTSDVVLSCREAPSTPFYLLPCLCADFQAWWTYHCVWMSSQFFVQIWGPIFVFSHQGVQVSILEQIFLGPLSYRRKLPQLYFVLSGVYVIVGRLTPSSLKCLNFQSHLNCNIFGKIKFLNSFFFKRFMERRVPCPLPRQYTIPLPKVNFYLWTKISTFHPLTNVTVMIICL